MEKLKIYVSGAEIHVTVLDKLTSGTVGATASFGFSPEWGDLLKTAVFEGSSVSKDVILTGSAVEIPPECLTRRGTLRVGVYGHLADGTIVIPTVMGCGVEISAGTKPSGDTQSGYTPEKWAQMLGMIGDISHLTTEDRSTLVAAINELVLGLGGKVDRDAALQIMAEYLAENPPTINESDPTVPEWAKQPQKPNYTAAEVGAQPKGKYVTSVNGSSPDENGNVNIPVMDESGNIDLSGYAKTEDIPTKPEQVGAAPSGFGLGEEDAPLVSEGEEMEYASEITKSGFYQVDDVTWDVPTGGEVAPLLHLSARSGKDDDPSIPTAAQFVVDWEGSIAYRNEYYYSDGYSPWKYLTYPLRIGEEYLTAERFNGNPVFIQAVNCGTLPSNGSKTVDFSTPDGTIRRVIDWYGSTSNGQALPFTANYSVYIDLVQAGQIVIRAEGYTAGTAVVVVKYVKE